MKKSLFAYTWPIFIELLLQLLVSNIDKIMVNSISDTAVSSVANATTVLDVVVIAFTVISLSITILASQYFGRNDHIRIAQVYSMGILITGVVAVLVSLILLLSAGMIFEAIRVPSECYEGSVIYLNIVAGGLLFQGVYNAYVAIFRTQGWMKQTMAVSAGVNILNTVGNFFLIYGFAFIPSLGVAGAAISSVFSRFIGLLVLIYIFNRRSAIRIDFSLLRPWPNQLFKTMLYVGLPSGGEALSYSASQMVILSFVNLLGNAMIKLRSFANMFQMCAYMFGSAVSQASQIIVGYLIGKGEKDQADKEVRKTLILSVVISAGVSFLFYLFSDQVFGFFIDDPSLLAVAKQIMLVEVVLESSRAVNMTLVRCLQASGDTLYPTFIGILSMWGVATLLAYVFGIWLKMGLLGVWIAMCLDETLRAIIFLIRWFSGKWRKRQLL